MNIMRVRIVLWLSWITIFVAIDSSAMDLPRAFYECRPNATFLNGANFASLGMANSRYDYEDKVTQSELDVCWADIQAQDIKSEKIEGTELLANQKVDVLMVTPSIKRKLKATSRAIKLVLKKVKGSISAGEENELNAFSELSDQTDAIYSAADS
ncbi:hypothetical protein KAU11_07400, partial [Candidatus Babeliales bacterium]|nr:hypothetical protein [Candidatus Babeliales bacterium]